MRLNAGLVATSLRQDSPSDPRQLVGERNAQNIAMHAPGRRRQPRSKAMLCPTCRSEQDGTGALDEEHAQIAVSALGDTAKDGAITRRHLLRHQAKLGRKITAFAIGSAIADCSHNRTRDDRTDPWNRD